MYYSPLILYKYLSKSITNLKLTSLPKHYQFSHNNKKTIKKMQIRKITKLFIIFTVLCCISYQISLPVDDPSLTKYTPSRKNNDKYSTILGFVLGPVLFVMSFVGVWFNEKRAAVNYTRLKLAQKLVDEDKAGQSIQLTQMQTNFLPTKRLVHKVGASQIIQAARDEQCQVFPADAIVINRKVQVKEMRSYSKRRSDQQQVQYRLQWVSQNIQQCVNQSNSPIRWFIGNKVFYAPRVIVAGYNLIEEQMKMLECQTEVNPTPETVAALSYLAQRVGGSGQPIVFNNYVYFPASNGDVQSRGTLRVKFMYCQSTQLSIMSTVDQTTRCYQPFRIDLVDNNGHQDQVPCSDAQCCICCGKLAQSLKPLSQINLILKGQYNYHEMIAITVKKNTTQTNILRVVFFFIMVIGICAFFSPFVEVLGYLPIVGGFLKGTAGIIVFLAAFIISIPLFFVTFGLAWLRYHPVIGGAVTLIAVAAMVTLSMIQKK